MYRLPALKTLGDKINLHVKLKKMRFPEIPMFIFSMIYSILIENNKIDIFANVVLAPAQH